MVRWPAGRSGMSPNFLVPNGAGSERLTSPLTVGSDLHKRWSAQRWAATYSHGGSQGFKSPHLHPTKVLVTGLAGHFRRVGAFSDTPDGQQMGSNRGVWPVRASPFIGSNQPAGVGYGRW